MAITRMKPSLKSASTRKEAFDLWTKQVEHYLALNVLKSYAQLWATIDLHRAGLLPQQCMPHLAVAWNDDRYWFLEDKK